MPTLNSTELAILTTDQQKSQLYLSVFKPTVLVAATVSGTQTRGKGKIPVTVTTGTTDDIVAGMTMLLGSGAGKADYGKIRVKGVEDGAITVAENSFDWPDGMHLTVVKDWLIWPVYHKVSANGDLSVTQDGSIGYSGQNEALSPVVVMGPPAVEDLSHTPTARVYYDASESWSPMGNAISSYAWTFEGGTPSSSSSATPGYVTYAAAGHYWTFCTVTDEDGNTYTGRRQVIIHDSANPPITKFEVRNLSGDYGRRGWEMEFILREDLPKGTYLDGALVILWGRSWYGRTRKEFGRVAGREKILFVGWIQEESANRTPYDKPATIKAFGPVPWLDDLSAFPVTLEYNDDPSKWWEMPGLTLDKALWFFLRWSTTALTLCDYEQSGLGLLAKYLDFEGENVGGSIETAMYERGCFLKFASNQYGQLILEKEVQIHSGTVPAVLDLNDSHWREEEVLAYRPRIQLAWCELSGVYFNGSEPEAVISMAPGDAPYIEGQQETLGNLVTPPQVGLNYLTGRYFGWKNNPFPEFRLPMAGNWSGVFDIIPQEAVRLSLNGTETRRGYVMTDQGFIVRGVTHRYDGKNLLTDLNCEMLTNGITGVDGRYPEEPPPDEEECQECQPCHPTYPCEDPDPDDGPLRRRVWIATRDNIYFVSNIQEPSAGEDEAAQPYCYDATLNLSGSISAFQVDPYDPEGYQFAHRGQYYGDIGGGNGHAIREVYYRTKVDDPDHPWLRPWLTMENPDALAPENTIKYLTAAKIMLEYEAATGVSDENWAAEGFTCRKQSGLVLDINEYGKLYFVVWVHRNSGPTSQRGRVFLVKVSFSQLESGYLQLDGVDVDYAIGHDEIGAVFGVESQGLQIGSFNLTKQGDWTTYKNYIYLSAGAVGSGAVWAVARYSNVYGGAGFQRDGSFDPLEAYDDPGSVVGFDSVCFTVDPNDTERIISWKETKLVIYKSGIQYEYDEGDVPTPAQVENSEVVGQSFARSDNLSADTYMAFWIGWNPTSGLGGQKMRFFSNKSNYWIASDDGGETWTSTEPGGAIGPNVATADNSGDSDDRQLWGVVAVQDAQSKYYAGKRGVGPNRLDTSPNDGRGDTSGTNRTHIFCISTDDGVTWTDRSGFNGEDPDGYDVVRMIGQVLNIVPIWTDTDT